MDPVIALFRQAGPATVLARGAGFLGLWVVLIGASPKDLPLGLVAAAAATWASLELWPARGTLSFPGLIRFILRFLPQSVVAGVDVAWRAFSPRLELRPGITTYRTTLASGPACRALCAVMSLQPGKLPVATAADGTLQVHCLDLREPVARQLAADEAAFLDMLGRDNAHG